MLIDVAAADGSAEAWLARPTTASPDTPLPGVLLFMDAIGLRPRIFEMADRIASWGYVVLAPNVFYRVGTSAETTPGRPLDSEEARREFFKVASGRISSLTAKRAVADIAAYVKALTSLEDVRTPVGVVGYCMGARLAVRAAAAHPDIVAACGGFHGGGLASAAADSPHRALPAARAEFVFGHADHDPSMNPEAIARLDETLRAAGLTATNEIYEGASHGYTMADTGVYDEAATERHFVALKGLFARTLA